MTTNDIQRTTKVDLEGTRGQIVLMIASISAALTADDSNALCTHAPIAT